MDVARFDRNGRCLPNHRPCSLARSIDGGGRGSRWVWLSLTEMASAYLIADLAV